MGAILSKGGIVKWNRCIECPFHGGTFDGKTGKCVNSSSLDIKMTSHHEYNDIGKMDKKDGCFINKKEDNKESSLLVYEIMETNGLMYAWIHSKLIPP